MTAQRPAIGASLTRKEDQRFLTGEGRFGDDVALPDQAFGVVVRAPHAHARIRRIDADACKRMPGVVLVLTGADLTGRVKPLPSLTRRPPFRVPNRDGTEMPEPDQPVLATGKVRFLGEPVAFVVAQTLPQARDAAEALSVDYEPLVPTMTVGQALAEDAPAIWDETPGNVSFEWEGGDRTATDAAFADAHHVARVELVNNRVAPVFIEPRAAAAEVDPASGRLTLHTGSQSAHRVHEFLIEMLDLEPESLRVVTPDTGGGFGARGVVYPEMALVLLAAKTLGRPVKWTAERAESFLTDTQARDLTVRGELALDARGRFTALRVHADWRHGAYLLSRTVWMLVHYFVPTLGGVYGIESGHVTLRGVFSNTTPLYAYRGVGRVEATYLMESLVDAAARETGVDRIELRRRNMVRAEDLPWRAVGGARYEACRFEPLMAQALELARWDEFGTRCEQGRVRGIGCAVYVENDGGPPGEYAHVQVHSAGVVMVEVGTQDFGMGHETVYSQVVADTLQVPVDTVHVVDGDTDRVARGGGSVGSRSMRVGGTAIVLGAERVLARGRTIAASLMQASADDVEYTRGCFRIAGTEREVSLFQVAAAAEDEGEPLAAEADFVQTRESYSSGCHVCEVELDPETGRVVVLAHVVVSDVGRAVNPMLVRGQIHGGAAQGLGQAALEQVVYDLETGQTLSGSLLDYTLPRADDLPTFTTAIAETRETDNPLGVKGVGEGPTTGAPAAYMNAVRDALARAGAAPVQMPTTPERVWRALRDRLG